MTTASEVGVVVVTYNSSGHLEQLISSLKGEDVGPVVIWDNGSAPGEVRAVERLARDASVDVVFSEANLGFGAAVNRAVERLRSIATTDLEYVWILNPDVRVRPGSARTLWASAARNGYDLCSPLIVRVGGGRADTVWYSGGRIDRRAGRSVHDRIGRPVGASDHGSGPVTFVTGAAMLASLDAWDRLGGFDETLFLYCEDAELSMRATDLGLSMGVDRAAVVEHDEGVSSGGRASPTYYYYVQRNRLAVYAASSSRLGLLFGRGLGEETRLLVLPIRDGGRRRWAALSASVGGVLAGLRHETGPRSTPRDSPRAPVSTLQVYVEARTAHLERLVGMADTSLLYLRESYDFDDGVARSVAAERVSRLGALRRILTTSATTIELNEPAMLRALPTTLSAVLASRVRRCLGRPVPRVVAYAIENGDLTLAVRARLRMPRSLARRLVDVATVSALAGYDRLAFGTDDARRTYRQWLRVLKDPPVIATFEALEPACRVCSDKSKTPLSAAFVGSFEHRKGFDALLGAWAGVRGAEPSARLAILGQGPMESAARAAAARDSSITVTIEPSRQDIHDGLASASVLVLASRPERGWREQVGLPILEGLAHGCTIVTSSQTGLADWLRRAGHAVMTHDVTEESVRSALLGALRRPLDPDGVCAALPARSGRALADQWLRESSR